MMEDSHAEIDRKKKTSNSMNVQWPIGSLLWMLWDCIGSRAASKRFHTIWGSGLRAFATKGKVFFCFKMASVFRAEIQFP